jgi:hypothetical protein
MELPLDGRSETFPDLNWPKNSIRNPSIPNGT